ncbi:MAG: hypothetical protein ACLQU1_19555 [Bryobacteraceae bacterium]
MRLAALITMAAVGTGAWAAEAGKVKGERVTVCMKGDPGIPATWPAESMASRIFSAIAVKLDWNDGPCPASPNTLKISVVDRAAEGQPAGTLAYALPYDEGSHIVVFYDPIQRMQCGCAQQLLAYVLVHEITHILEGIARHSQGGIMKAHWDDADYDKIRARSLVFAEEDVDLIHRGLDARAASAAGKGTMQLAAR